LEDRKFSKLINEKRLIDTFFELLRIKSPSRKEEEISAYLQKELKKIGVRVKNDNCGEKFGSNAGNILAENSDSKNGTKEPIFLAAHMDTVKLNGEVIPKISDGKIVNENKDCILGGDDKVALAAILEALKALKENGIEIGKVYIIITVSEEIGILGAKEFDIDSVDAKYGLVFDAEGDIGVINNRAPYHNYLKFEVTGRSAHAGIEPEKGINAILVASEAISGLNTGRIDEDTTANIGLISGGTATNIIPERAVVECEARSLVEKKLEKTSDHMIKRFKETAKKYKAIVNEEKIREYDGFDIKDDDYSIKLAKKAIKKLGLEPRTVSTGGGSDINIFNARGKSSVNLSSGMERVHSNEEYVKTEQLVLLTELIMNICTLKV